MVENNHDYAYKCDICNKLYKDKSGLWYHNKKIHTDISTKFLNNSSINLNNSSKLIKNNLNNNLKCYMCNKIYSRSDNLKRHLLNCNKKNEFEEKQDKLQEKINTLESKIEILNKLSQKPTTKIINKVNGNIIGTNTDNGPKQIIYKTGSENIDTISYNEVSTIFDNEISSVIKLIELINFNETKPENHSFCSTALESPYLSFYNTDTNSVNKERKRYFFEEVICKSIQNHEILYDKFKNKFNSIKKKKIEDNIANLKKMRENSFSSKIMGELIRNLNLLSYNKRNLIQDTWNGEYENESDEEFMKMILDEPKDTKTIENIEYKHNLSNIVKKKQLFEQVNILLNEINEKFT
jgi:hypothetical protein